MARKQAELLAPWQWYWEERRRRERAEATLAHYRRRMWLMFACWMVSLAAVTFMAVWALERVG